MYLLRYITKIMNLGYYILNDTTQNLKAKKATLFTLAFLNSSIQN